MTKTTSQITFDATIEMLTSNWTIMILFAPLVPTASITKRQTSTKGCKMDIVIPCEEKKRNWLKTATKKLTLAQKGSPPPKSIRLNPWLVAEPSPE